MPTHDYDLLLQICDARHSLLAHAEAYDVNAVRSPEPADALACVHGAYQAPACVDTWMPPVDSMAYACWDAGAQAAPLMQHQPAPTDALRYASVWPQWDASSFYMCPPMPIEEHAVIDPATLDMPRRPVGVAGPEQASAGTSKFGSRAASAQGNNVCPAGSKGRAASSRYALVSANTGAPATPDDSCVIHLQTWRKRRPVDAQSGCDVPAGTPGAVPRWRYERTRWPLKSQAKGLRKKRPEKAKVAQQD